MICGLFSHTENNPQLPFLIAAVSAFLNSTHHDRRRETRLLDRRRGKRRVARRRARFCLRAGRRAACGRGGRGTGVVGGDRAWDADDGAAARPRAVDELQAASAVGQGTVFRAYEQRLAGRGVHAGAGAADLVRLLGRDALPQRPPDAAAAAGDGARSPVVNENDTTATDEITFGDNDFLSAQVAILLGARLLVLLTDTDGLHTADPSHDPGRRWSRTSTTRRARRLRDRRSRVALRIRRDAEQGRRRGDGERGRDRGGDLRRDGAADLLAAAAGRRVGTRFVAHPERDPAFKLWLRHAKPARGRVVVDDGAARVLRESGSSLLPVGIVGIEGEFAAGDAVDVVCGGTRSARGSSTTRPSSWSGSRG